VGRLGVLTSVEPSIVQQRPVQRLLQTTSTAEFTAQVKAVQDAYTAALNSGSIIALAAALSQIDETQVIMAPVCPVSADTEARCRGGERMVTVVMPAMSPSMRSRHAQF